MRKDRRRWEEAGIPALIPASAWRRIEKLARAGRSIDGSAGELGVAYGMACNYIQAVRRA